MTNTDTIDISPTWETAARIYLAVLQNPKAPAATRRDAENEMLRLARAFDKLTAKEVK